jgi:hypothetical protein
MEQEEALENAEIKNRTKNSEPYLDGAGSSIRH